MEWELVTPSVNGGTMDVLWLKARRSGMVKTVAPPTQER